MPQNTTEDFINASLKVHGDKYDYSGATYLDSRLKVIIICKTHGYFFQRPTHHLDGRGCTKCHRDATSNATRQKFIKAAREVHGRKYSYTIPDNMKVKDVLSILCQQHGVFKQRSDHHVKGAGCPSCAKYGFDQKAPGYLYLLKSDDGNFCKIGVTGHIKQRMGQLRKNTPFTFGVSKVLPMWGGRAWGLEKQIKKTSHSAGFSDFDGASEWLTNPDTVEAELEQLYFTAPTDTI